MSRTAKAGLGRVFCHARGHSVRRVNLNNLAAQIPQKEQVPGRSLCVSHSELKGATTMLGLNNVQIIGNLGGTPEMKYLNNSDHVVNFSVAVNERWKNRAGESQERTTWLRIVAFNGLGSACAEY